MRFWVGMWTVLIILIIVIFNLSSLVKYITRFTEDSFATLIAVIFIVEAFKKLFEINTIHSPVNFHPNDPIPTNCTCLPRDCSITTTPFAPTTTGMLSNATTVATVTVAPALNFTCADVSNFTSDMWNTMTIEGCKMYGGSLVGDGCNPPHYVADVFFLSILLFIGTFSIAIALVSFKTSTIFPAVVRNSNDKYNKHAYFKKKLSMSSSCQFRFPIHFPSPHI